MAMAQLLTSRMTSLEFVVADMVAFQKFIYLFIYHFYQSAALPPLGAPAQTWKPKTVNINTLASTAAAASVQIHIGSALLVFLIQPLELGHGNQQTRFALQKAAASRVS